MKMIDYNKSIIYILYSHNTENVHIGSTTQTLSQRKAQLKHYCDAKPRNNKLIKEILDHSHSMRILERYPCSDIEHLRDRLEYYIDLYQTGKLKKPTKITIKKTSFKLSVTD